MFCRFSYEKTIYERIIWENITEECMWRELKMCEGKKIGWYWAE